MPVNIKKKKEPVKKTKIEVAKEATILVDGDPVQDGEELHMAIINPKAHLSVEYPDGTVKNLDFKVSKGSTYIGPVVNVGISLAFTHNSGNYSNTKCQVSIHVPCSHEEIEETYEFVKDWAEEKINELHEQECKDD